LVVEAKTTLQTQLTTLSSSQSSTSSEVEILRRRVDDTEREKRDLVGVISRLKDEGTQRDGQNNNHSVSIWYISLVFLEEIHTLRVNLKEARMEHQSMEAQLRELRSTETVTKVGFLFMLTFSLTSFPVQNRFS